ncbi:MAG: DegT/DnrJ/EryC1/StrS family aminotransferase [Candidatus Omnitrophica bacterium]|nr:DegT/DnrJ/EryC1/StrS family aminotransferase [Candidatus Omnitrophota bacterium]
MKPLKIKLSKPYIPSSGIKEVQKVLKSGNLVQGEVVKKFELALQKYLGTRHAILVSSGTAALHLALLALDIKEGDEVIVPAFTFPATANVVELVKAKPVFVDIALDDFCMDVRKIEKCISKRTKAIIPVHEFGQPADIKKIMSVAKKRNITVVEDAACALGAKFGNQMVGTFGKIGCFSFHPRKILTTGEGGLLVTDDVAMAEKLRSLRSHGICVKNGKMDFDYAGLNYRMTDFQAALGLSQMAHLEKMLKARVALAKAYDQGLAGISWIKTPLSIQNRKNVYQTYHVMLNQNVSRDALIQKLRDQGIEANLGAQALPCLSYYQKRYKLKERDFLNAREAYTQGLALPMHFALNEKDIKHVIRKLELSLGGINS